MQKKYTRHSKKDARQRSTKQTQSKKEGSNKDQNSRKQRSAELSIPKVERGEEREKKYKNIYSQNEEGKLTLDTTDFLQQ